MELQNHAAKRTLTTLCILHVALSALFLAVVLLFMPHFGLTAKDESEMTEIVRRAPDVARAAQAAEAFLSTYQSVNRFAKAFAGIALGFSCSSLVLALVELRAARTMEA